MPIPQQQDDKLVVAPQPEQHPLVAQPPAPSFSDAYHNWANKITEAIGMKPAYPSVPVAAPLIPHPVEPSVPLVSFAHAVAKEEGAKPELHNPGNVKSHGQIAS